MTSSSPFSRLMAILNHSDRRSSSRANVETNNGLLSSIRPARPSRQQGQIDLIANFEGNRAIQSSKSFETQGIILPVHIDRSSLSISKISEVELEITGKIDCNVSCQVVGHSDSWKKACPGSELKEGLAQDFSVIIPNFASFGPKAIELVVSESGAGSHGTTINKAKFNNPFYINKQYTKISLTRNDNGMIFIKADDQYIKLRNKNFSLLEIYGKPSVTTIRSNASSPTSYCSDGLSNRECIICMSEVKDTIVLPCRHMCLCSDCAETIRGRSDKCPLCRQGNYCFFKGCFNILLGYRALLHIKYVP